MSVIMLGNLQQTGNIKGNSYRITPEVDFGLLLIVVISVILSTELESTELFFYSDWKKKYKAIVAGLFNKVHVSFLKRVA